MVLQSSSDSTLASIFACCTSCHIRKQGGTWPRLGPTDFDKRVLLIGKSESGKSRLVSCLREVAVESPVYEPTNGTLVAKVAIPPLSLTFVEIGGKLSEFWHRSVDTKVDGIWYLMTPEEVTSRDFSTFTRFLRLASETINSRNIPVLVTSLSTSDLKPLLESEIEKTGVVFSRLCFAQIAAFDGPGLGPALDALKKCLIVSL